MENSSQVVLPPPPPPQSHTIEKIESTPTNKRCECCEDFGDCNENWYRYIAYYCVVFFCCPCICLDKCGCCKTSSNSTSHNNGVASGIAIGIALRV